jgi:hypothetical protein
LELPDFNLDGLLSPGDYEMTLDDLKASMLVVGPGESYPNWDSGWRLRLVENLEAMVGQLWEVGVTEIFLDGSFVEDKDHPGDIDGYFECEVLDIATGRLQRGLNELDTHKAWTWDPRSRRPYKNQPKRQLPMWHRYRVELYPHYVDVALESQGSGIQDEFGNDLPFPAAFRKSRREHKPKGIVKVVKR